MESPHDVTPHKYFWIRHWSSQYTHYRLVSDEYKWDKFFNQNYALAEI